MVPPFTEEALAPVAADNITLEREVGGGELTTAASTH
jgi:hypothetical protein